MIPTLLLIAGLVIGFMVGWQLKELTEKTIKEETKLPEAVIPGDRIGINNLDDSQEEALLIWLKETNDELLTNSSGKHKMSFPITRTTVSTPKAIIKCLCNLYEDKGWDVTIGNESYDKSRKQRFLEVEFKPSKKSKVRVCVGEEYKDLNLPDEVLQEMQAFDKELAKSKKRNK